jgi:hypothetical protein
MKPGSIPGYDDKKHRRYNEKIPSRLMDISKLEELLEGKTPGSIERNELTSCIKHWSFWEENEYRLLIDLRGLGEAFKTHHSNQNGSEETISAASYIQYGGEVHGANGRPGIFLKCKHYRDDLDCSENSYLRFDAKFAYNERPGGIIEYTDLSDMEKKLASAIDSGMRFKSLTIPQGKKQVEAFEKVDRLLFNKGRRNFNTAGSYKNEPDSNYCYIRCNGH